MSYIYDDSKWIVGLIIGITVSYVYYLYDKRRRFVILINKIPGPKTVFFFGNMLPFLRSTIEGKGGNFHFIVFPSNPIVF